MGFYLNKKFYRKQINMKCFKMLMTAFLIVVYNNVVAGQTGCFTICPGEQPAARHHLQTQQSQGPPGKRGPIGHVGMKGDKGEAGEVHSDAEALRNLTGRFENLLKLTTKLESELNHTNSALISTQRKQLEMERFNDKLQEALNSTQKKQLEMEEKLNGFTPTCSVEAAGIEHTAIIGNGQLSASSSYDSSSGSSYAVQRCRLHSTTGYGWLMSQPYRVGEWLQVDFQKNRRIHGVATQGCRGHAEYTTTYKMEFKKDGLQNFETITNDEGNVKIFNGNVDGDTVVKNEFDEVTARYVRISPVTWRSNPYIRWELFVCA